MPFSRDPFTRAAFERRQRIEYDAIGHTAAFISREDIVVAKLIAFRETSSDKHLQDARGVLVTQWGFLDEETLRRRTCFARVGDLFQQAWEMVRQEVEG